MKVERWGKKKKKKFPLKCKWMLQCLTVKIPFLLTPPCTLRLCHFSCLKCKAFMLSFNSIWNEAEKKTEGNVNNFIERHFTELNICLKLYIIISTIIILQQTNSCSTWANKNNYTLKRAWWSSSVNFQPHNKSFISTVKCEIWKIILKTFWMRTYEYSH